MKTREWRVLLGALTIVLMSGWLTGCATPPSAHHRPALADWPVEFAFVPELTPEREATLEWPPAASQAQPEVKEPVATVVERRLPTERVSDLAFTEVTDVATVLRALAKAADLNMMISPHVKGDVHFTFRDVPWDEVFRSVLSSTGLTYAWEGDILRVLTIDDLRREMEIESVQREREGVRAELRLVQPMIMQVYPIRYARARNLGDSVRGALAAEALDPGLARSYVTIDEDKNAIIIHAQREALDKAAALINQLDQPKPQIHIEARIVEATRDTARQLGVQWGGGTARVQGSRTFTVGGPGVAAGGFVSDFPAQFSQGLTPDAGFSLGFLSERFTGSELLNMQLTALQRNGQIQILSSPSITTLDNETAIIESGEERAYRVTTGTGNILDVSLEWKKAVLKLEVTPHVVDGYYLRVDIIANKDSFDETRPQTNNEFPVNTKHASTTVMLRDGQTVVIGGLSQESKSNVQSGIPFFMRLPIVGHLFKNSGNAAKFDDTLIFITPRILRSEG